MSSGDNTEASYGNETVNPEPNPDYFTLRNRDLAHFKHPLARIRNEYIFLCLGLVLLYLPHFIDSKLRFLSSFLWLHSLISYGLSLYGGFYVFLSLFYMYQTRFQPHPYYDHPDPACGMPKDPGGEQLLRTGLPAVVDRKSKIRILEEGRAEFSFVKFIYAPHSIKFIDSFTGILMHLVGKYQPYLAQLLRYSYYERWWSRYFIKGFVKQFKLSLEDYVIPEGGFKTFQQFFTRYTKPGARPIEGDSTVIVTPCDCRGLFYKDAKYLSSIKVKGQQFELNELIGEQLVKDGWNVNNTAFGLLRLNPADYHRYHVPYDCKVLAVKTLGSKVHSIQGSGNLLGIGILHENERKVVLLGSASDPEDRSKQCIYIPIGACFVGSCNITAPLGAILAKGDEIGHFAFGGSTICVLFRNDAIEWDQDLIEYTQQNIEVKILQGQRIGKWKF